MFLRCATAQWTLHHRYSGVGYWRTISRASRATTLYDTALIKNQQPPCAYLLLARYTYANADHGANYVGGEFVVRGASNVARSCSASVKAAAARCVRSRAFVYCVVICPYSTASTS